MNLKQTQVKLLSLASRLNEFEQAVTKKSTKVEDKSLLVPVQLSTYFSFTDVTPPLSENQQASKEQLYRSKESSIVNGAEDVFINKIYYSLAYSNQWTIDSAFQSVRNNTLEDVSALLPYMMLYNFSWNFKLSSSQRYYLTKNDQVQNASYLSLGQPTVQRPIQFKHPLKIPAGDIITIEVTPLAKPFTETLIPGFTPGDPSGFGVYFSLHGWRNGEMK